MAGLWAGAAVGDGGLNEARAQLERGEWRAAQTRLETLCAERAGSSRWTAADVDACHVVHAEALARVGRAEEGARLAEEALRRIRARTSRAEAALELDAMQSLSIAYYRLGRFRDAAAESGRAWEGRSSLLGKQHEDTLKSMNTYAVSLTSSGEIERAMDLQESLVTSLDAVRGPEHEQTLRARANLAVSLSRAGRYVEAEARYRELLATRQSKWGREHPQTLLLVTSLANVLVSAGRPAEAAAELVPRLPAYRTTFGEGTIDHIAALVTEARIAYDLGHYDEALLKGRATLAQSRKALGPAHPRTLAMLFTLGTTHYRRLEFAAAREAFEEVRAANEKAAGPNDALALDARNAVAFAALQLGELEFARREFDVVRSVAGTARDLANVRTTALAGHGQASFELGDREQAMRDLEAVLAERRASGARILPTLATLARYEIIAGRDDRAEERLEELVAVVDKAYREDAAPSELRLSQLAAWIDDDFDVAGFKALAEIRVRKGRPAEALALIEASRARVLREVMATDARVEGAAASAERESLRRIRASIAELDQRLANPDLDIARREQLRATRADWESRLAIGVRHLQAGEFAPPAAPLAPGEAYVAYSVNRERVIVIVRAGGAAPVGIDLGTVHNLESTITAWRRVLESADASRERVWAVTPQGYRWSLAIPARDSRRVTDAEEIASYLGRVLIAPIMGAAGGAQRWYVSLDGPLHLLPFDALRVHGRRVVEDREIVGAPSLAVLGAITARAPTAPLDRNVLALGALSAETYGSRGLGALPDARSEIEAIASTFGARRATVLLGDAATEARVRGMDESGELARYRFIHVASHGALSLTDPQASGVALGATGGDPQSDGWLNAGEWATLRLASDLVTLSACSTGSGRFVRGEGIVGLPSALIAAGARSALLSLWAVSDEGTTRFMAAFYRRLHAGAAPARALRETKLEFARSKGPWSSPRHWAPYVLYGAT